VVKHGYDFHQLHPGLLKNVAILDSGSYGAPDLNTTTFVQSNSWHQIYSFCYPSCKNAPFGKLNKTTRAIFIFLKTDGVKIFSSGQFGHLM
jgi:hypothetical protein